MTLMPRSRICQAFAFVLAVLAVLCAVTVGCAHAAAPAAENFAVPAAHDAAPGYVYFTQTAYVAHEDENLQITIARTDDTVGEDVRYGVRHLDAEGGLDLQTIGNTLVHFYPGQSTYTFTLHIIDRGMNATPVYADAYLFGAYPQPLGDATGKTYAHGPVNSRITIARDDPLDTRNPADLLGFGATPPASATNPLQDANFYVAGNLSPAGLAARRYQHSNPVAYRDLQYLAQQPGVHRFFYWNTPAWPAHTVARYLESTENRQPNTVVQLSTYSLVHNHECGANTTSPAFFHRYERWVRGLARGIGNFHVVMFFELDGIITTQCMAHHPARLRARLAEIRDGIATLEKLPHTAVYIDAGAADAISAPRTASLLRRAGVKDAQGFFVNSTHFDWTTKEVAYGQKISRMLGGVHFVVNTGENGRGPLVPPVRFHVGNELLCNPPGRGLGPMSTETGYKDVDGFLWFTNPGGSAGDTSGCGHGAPPTGVFWPTRAVQLVQDADFHITGPSEHLQHDGPYVPYDALTRPAFQTPR
jgi:hypothetical protein